MITPDGLDEMARDIAQSNGISLEVARRYADLIGDTPEITDDGLVVVPDEQGHGIARVRLPPGEKTSGLHFP